jgi:hypothetical protein
VESGQAVLDGEGMLVTCVAEIRLAGDRVVCVGGFRRFVGVCLVGLPAAVAPDGRVVASELSSNAAHSRSALPGGTYIGRVQIGVVDVLSCVIDQGSELRAPHICADTEPQAASGRGLLICSEPGRLTTELTSGGGRRVWVRIPMPGRTKPGGAAGRPVRDRQRDRARGRAAGTPFPARRPPMPGATAPGRAAVGGSRYGSMWRRRWITMASMGEQSRATRVWALITAQAAGDTVSVRQVCAACVSAVGVDGAAVWLATDLNRRALLYATDQVALVLDEVDFTLGEGPCAQAWSGRGMVLAADLAAPGNAARWPIFTPAAVAAGAGAIFAFPLQAGAIRIGVLGLYRARPGPLSGEQLADALAFSFAAFTLVLHQSAPQAGPATDGASSGSELAAWPFDGLGEGKAEVYQATGMVAVQLNTHLDEALLRLRAHAFAYGLGVTEVARQVVARTLHFNPHDK